ncbi:MAG: signal peptidase I [Anaerolineae bacterium]|nr:signal peptidase I [Anaerolineae bacterium]
MYQYPYSQDDPGPQPKINRVRPFLREVVETLLLMLAIYTFVNLTLPQYMVEGRSMEPNFHDGQRLVVSRAAYMLGEPQRGDVVVLRNPTDPTGKDLIKRLVGLPGDHIVIENGAVYVNDTLLNEPYIEDLGHYSGEWQLGPEEYFVLGDNRNNSRDSHYFGPIDRTLIVGRAWISLWPPQSWGIVPDYANALNVPNP